MTQNPAPAANSGAAMFHRQAIDALTAGRVQEGIAALEKAVKADPSNVDIRNDLGAAYWRLGNGAKAEAQYVAALKLAPQNPYVLNNYGACLLGMDRVEEAGRCLSQAVALKRDHYEIPNNVGLLHRHVGNYPAAEAAFKEAIRLNPRWPDAYNNLGDLAQFVGQHHVAEKAYRHALTLQPNNIHGWRKLSGFYKAIGKFDDAEECCKRAISLDPNSETSWVTLLMTQEAASRIDEAFKTAETAKKRFPKSPHIPIVEARLLRRAGKIEEAIALLKNVRKKLDLASPEGIDLLFEMGQLYDRADDVDQAFQSFVKAKQGQTRKAAAQLHEKKQYVEAIARLRREFTPELAKAIQAAPAPKAAKSPVFLVGFPRSGTTLLDQILSSHPQVAVAEEAPVVTQMRFHLVRKYGGVPPKDLNKQSGIPDWVENNPCYPACLPNLTEQDITQLREIFFGRHGGRAGEAGATFVDKLPLNLRDAGLIHRVFPEAKFIFALRHPCDAVLSCLMQNFGLNSAMMNFLDLESGARLYDEAFSLWEQYRRLLPLQVHEIRYEDVVADFRPAIAALLEFLGLEWNDAVLEYDKTAKKRGINTPSYAQVTEKIYTRASGRWQKYRKHLEPVFQTLEPHAKRYGYSLDPQDVQE